MTIDSLFAVAHLFVVPWYDIVPFVLSWPHKPFYIVPPFGAMLRNSHHIPVSHLLIDVAVFPIAYYVVPSFVLVPVFQFVSLVWYVPFLGTVVSWYECRPVRSYTPAAVVAVIVTIDIALVSPLRVVTILPSIVDWLPSWLASMRYDFVHRPQSRSGSVVVPWTVHASVRQFGLE